jgi:hypothetical protein
MDEWMDGWMDNYINEKIDLVLPSLVWEKFLLVISLSPPNLLPDATLIQ